MTNNSSTLTTNLGAPPYNDDFSEEKNFHRILIKPGFPVQARELNQMQSMLQKQIDKFGKHVFREGSIVLPGQFNIEQDSEYVKVRDLDNSNNSVTIQNFESLTVTGLTNNVSAVILDTAEGTETEDNTKTIYVGYLTGASDNTSIKRFQPGEVLTSSEGNLVVIDSSDSTGVGSRFIIQQGVLFAKEHFISFQTQSVILDRYNAVPTCRVGFFIQEEIIDHTEDVSLLDPALGSSNFSAPGADRLKLTPILTVLDIDDDLGAPDFVELFTIKDGVVVELFERSQYNILKDELAKRTLDESGDYYVRGLGVRVRENLDTGTNDGYLLTGNSQMLSVGVEPGLGYVKGYEISKLVTDYVTIEKSTAFNNVTSQIATSTQGNYIKCKEVMGNIVHDRGNPVLLRDAPGRSISTGGSAFIAPTGNTIGTARVKSVEYDSGLLGTPDGTVNLYLFDVRMNGTNNFSSTRSAYISGFVGDFVLDSSNNSVLKESSSDVLLYPVGSKSVRNIKDTSGNPSVSFNFKRTSDVTIIQAGNPINIPLSTSGEVYPYGTVGSLSSADKRDIIISIKNSVVNISGSGTVSNVGDFTLFGSGTSFNNLNIGDKVKFQGNTKPYVISAISNNTYLATSDKLPNLSGASYWKSYLPGDIIDLTGKGFTSGATRTVSATPTSLSVDLKETYPSDISGSITYQVARSGGREYSKVLIPNVAVRINVAAQTSSTYNLGIPDVYQIRNIVRKTGSFPTSLSDGSDATDLYEFDNGQRDNMYDHATIRPKTTPASTDRLLVVLDYFEPSYTSGVGYASVDSYPINDTSSSNTSIRTEEIPFYVSPTTKSGYDLRNYIDFRPIKSLTASSTTTIGSSTINPARSGAFNFEANGIRLPAPSTQYVYNYSYFLSRIDLVIIDKNSVVSVIKGVPKDSPRTPPVPENVMGLASISVAPYPSLAPNYAQSINRQDLATIVKKISNIRFTMRDIGVLKKRITNLEFYTQLSLLEKAALDLKVLDENGLDRFKNGIFVNSFNDHILSDTTNPDYRIVVDKKEKSIRPVFTTHSLFYDYLSGSNVTKTGDLVTLPYTHKVLIDQPQVTSFRNIELSSYRFVGRMDLYPDLDVWVDTNYLPDEAISIGPTGENLPQGTFTEWNAWQTQVTGYQVDAQKPKVRSMDKDGYVYGGTFDSIGNHKTVTTPNSPRDQRVVEYSTHTRSGEETSYDIIEEQVTLGSRVVDTSLAAYIRPQSIIVRVRGLKRRTRMFVFFDGEDMTDYVTPITYEEFNLGTPVLYTNLSSNEGDSLIVDEDGESYFILRLPLEKRFRVGTKEIVVTDSMTNSVDATTFAKSTFVSQGLIQQKQGTILTTRQINIEIVPITEQKTTTRVFYLDNPSCSAYSIYVKAPKEEEGVFMSKVDLYIQAKHPTLGFWVEIREMDSAGGITRAQVPFSEVWVDADGITLSPDGYNDPHTITFPSPVFLYSDTQYAFVIHTVGLNPDIYFWISRLGETDLRTGNQVNARPLTGTFYTTNNNLNWDMVPDIDLRCTFYRAAFSTNVNGVITLGNEPFERLLINNASSPLSTPGEGVIGNFRMTVSSNAGSILVGNRVIGGTSSANATVIAKSGSVITVGNTHFLSGETITVYESNMTPKSITTPITNIDSARGVIDFYKTYNGNTTVEIVGSNGKFYQNDRIIGTKSGVAANVSAIQRQRYSTLDFEPTFLSFNKTGINFSMQTTSNTGVQGSYTEINHNDNILFDEEKAILSRTQELALIGGDRSNKVQITINSSTEFLSPVVDVGRTHSVFVDNLINHLPPENTSENAPSGGDLFNRYISPVITLAEGQDAQDLLVQLTSYRPPSTDVRVWFKVIHSEDSDTMGIAPWREMTKVLDRAFSSISNRNDFKEYTYKVPDSLLTGPATDNSPGGELQYTNSQGIVFTGFKYFAIKVGLQGTNSAIVPKVADLRAIALLV